MLVHYGEVTSEEVERALDAQAENDQPIGEILVAWNALCRPALVHALAEQRGIKLDEERGFGTGLRAEIERRHTLRRAAA
jgi:hypothetical protein